MKRVSRFRKNSKIKSRVIILFCLFILIPLIAANILNYLLLSTNLAKNSDKNYGEILYQTKQNIDIVTRNIESITTGIGFNYEIQNLLQEEDLDLESKDYIKSKVIDVLLGNFKMFYNIVSNIIIFSSDGNIISSYEGYQLAYDISLFSWYEQAEKSLGNSIWISSHFDQNDFSTDEKVISVVKKIRSLGKENSSSVGADIGYILINIKEDEIYSLLSEVAFGQSGYLLIANEDNEIISCSDKTLLGEKWNSDFTSKNNNKQDSGYINLDGKEIFISYCTLEKSDWKLIGILSKDEINKDSKRSLYISLIITGMLLIVFVFLAIKVSDNIAYPIKDLRTFMKKVEKGSFNNIITAEYKIEEINDLVNSFNVMVTRLKMLVSEAYDANIKEKELETAIKQAELNALQQQINPHFLYNTLDSINWMARLEGKQEISNMATALGDFFRTSINYGLNFISISDEIKNIEYYIYIQKIRYSEKLDVVLDMDEDIYQYKTIKLLLQPLVENAIIHGIEPKKDKGTVYVMGMKVENDIQFEINDDGIGMIQEEIQKILDISSNKNGVIEKCVGIKNVIERLKLNFKDKYTFNITSEINKGTKITVVFPCFKDKQDLK